MTLIEEFDTLYEKLEEKEEEYVKKITDDLEAKFKYQELIIKPEVTSRIKDRKSLIKKIELKNGKYEQIKEITDLIGIRIIANLESDLNKITDYIKDNYKVDGENSVDKSNGLNPDTFGYLSNHLVIKIEDENPPLRIEIQIRSLLQHSWATFTHDLDYKNPLVFPNEIKREFARIASHLEVGDKLFNDLQNKIKEHTEKTNDIKESGVYDPEMLFDKLSIDYYFEKSETYNHFKNMIIEKYNLNGITQENSLKALEFLALMRIETFKQLDKILGEENLEEKINAVMKVIYYNENDPQETDTAFETLQKLPITSLCSYQLILLLTYIFIHNKPEAILILSKLKIDDPYEFYQEIESELDNI